MELTYSKFGLIHAKATAVEDGFEALRLLS